MDAFGAIENTAPSLILSSDSTEAEKLQAQFVMRASQLMEVFVFLFRNDDYNGD